MEHKEYLENFFSALRFEEKEHKYFVGDEKLNGSVSDQIKKFVEYVDFEAIGKKTDIKLQLKPGTTKKLWDLDAEISCAIGNKAHFFGEVYPFHRNIKPTTGYEVAIVKFWEELPPHIIPVITEFKMYHLTLKFGGTADIILYNTITKKFIIGDYKTNKDLDKNFNFKTLLPPFSRLFDSPFNKYKLQFSFYQILFEQTGLEVEKRCLIYLQSTGEYQTFFTEDYTEELKKVIVNE